MKKLLSIILLILFSFTEFFSQCAVKNIPFEAGEIISYKAVYNWGFIWVDAGRVRFKVKSDILNGKNVFHFDSYGNSIPKYDWIYKVRDSFESWADMETLKPQKYIRNTSEGDYKVYNVFNFDYKKNKIYTQVSNTDKKATKDTLSLKKCTFDLLTAIYYARSINFTAYEIKSKIPMTFIVDNEIYNLNILYLGKETITTKDERTFNCLKFRPELVAGTIFDKNSDMTVWVTNDKNRVPVLVEAKVLVGYVKALLVNTSGLKYPLSSEIKN